MFEWLWGIKTLAIFDVWTIEHFLSGVSIGTLVITMNRKTLGELMDKISDAIHPKRLAAIKYRYDIFLVIMFAFVWETVEHYLETGLAGARVEYWFQGVEFWPNRLLSDPIMLLLGYLFVKKYPRAVWPARILSIIWLIVHIFIFPHSMWLHEIL